MKRRPVLWCLLILAVINIVIVAKLFAIEYLSYNGSVEGSFISIARVMAKYPGQWSWWPYWGCGMPFETAYLPLLHFIVAAVILAAHLTAARAFHVVIAAVYAGSALTVFWMALELSRRIAVSFIAALAYSCVSCADLFVPQIRLDSGSALYLRRLQILVAYGESPHTLALALLPLAIVFFGRAFTRNDTKWKVLAGLFAAAVVLSNAFGIVALGTALICWMLAFRVQPWWKPVATAAAIGVVSYCWISPWLSPTMIRAIRLSAPTAGGDFRYRMDSWIALALMVVVLGMLWWAMRRVKAPDHVQFFVLFGYIHTAFVGIWYGFGVAVIPQPGRYQLEIDMALLLAIVFGGAWLLDRASRVRRIAGVVAVVALLAQCVYAGRFAYQMIQPLDHPMEIEMARWLDEHRPGERAFMGGSASMVYNNVTDNPQLKGNHDQESLNPFLAIVAYTIYSDANAGDRAADYSLFWLKAYGTSLISVSGPESGDAYHPYAHPGKFEGRLPVIWRNGDNAIYEVPLRSKSLAHVIPAEAVVARTPIHGLDIAPAEAFVAALDDPRNPEAAFRWTGMDRASIHARVAPGQAIVAQVTYDRGWEAWAQGRKQRLRGDGLGLMVIEPDCLGECDIELRFTGGWERLLTRVLSVMAMLVAMGYWIVAAKAPRPVTR